MKTRIITAIVGILVLIGVMFTFNTMVFNLVIAAITLIAVHEIYSALGFEKKDWLMYAVLVPYTLLVMLSSYSAMRKLVMPVSFVLVTFFAIYLVVRNGTISYQKASGLLVFSGIVIFCFYSFILLKERLPVEKFGYDAVFFILLILCFAWLRCWESTATCLPAWSSASAASRITAPSFRVTAAFWTASTA